MMLDIGAEPVYGTMLLVGPLVPPGTTPVPVGPAVIEAFAEGEMNPLQSPPLQVL